MLFYKLNNMQHQTQYILQTTAIHRLFLSQVGRDL